MLKRILAAVVAGAVATTMAITASAAEVTVEKVLFTNETDIGTLKFETTLNLGNYNVDTQGFAVLELPASFTGSIKDGNYLWILGQNDQTVCIQANTLDINGVKPFKDAPNSTLISPATVPGGTLELKIYPGLIDNSNRDSGGNLTHSSTASVASSAGITINASSANRINIKFTLSRLDLSRSGYYPATGEPTDEEKDYWAYADKFEFNSNTKDNSKIDVNGLEAYTINQNGEKVIIGSQPGTIRPFGGPNFSDIKLDFKNVSTFDGSGATTDYIGWASEAFTVAEKAAIIADGAKIELVAELVNRPMSSTAMSYMTARVWDAVKDQWGRPFAMVIEGNVAKATLSRDQVYQEAYDEFNRSFMFDADGRDTKSVNNSIKSVKIVITYDDGTAALDVENTLDPEDEPELDFDGDEEWIDDEDEDDFIDDEDEDDFEWEENDENDDEDDNVLTTGNPGTGVALAIVPALIAGAAAVIARKRS